MDMIIDFLGGLFGAVNVASIVAVFVLVYLWGKLGATGKIQLLSSFATGLVVGVLQQFSLGALVDLQSWFNAIIYGIILGGLASGFYDAIKLAVAKGAGDALGFDEDVDG